MTEFWRSALVGSSFFGSPGVDLRSRTAHAVNLRRHLAVTPAITQMPPGVELERIELLSEVGGHAGIMAFDAPPPPANPGSPDGSSAPDAAPAAPPGAGHDPDDPFGSAPEVSDDVKNIIFKLLDSFPSGGAGECCPELQYAIPEDPKVGFGDESTRPLKKGETGPALKAFPIGFAFSWKGIWKEKVKGPSGRTCDCNCCEFVHIIVMNKWDVRPLNSSAKGGESSNKPPFEDNCTVWLKLPDDSYRKVMRPRSWGSAEDLKKLKEEDPDMTGAEVVARHCYGDRSKLPAGLPNPERPEYLDSCHLYGKDEPSHPLYDGYEFKWSWVSYGVVLDTCVRVVSLIRELSVEAKGFLFSKFEETPNIMPSTGKSRTVYARPKPK